MKKQKIYDIFFPSGKKLPFNKTRWTVMIILQELMMGKYKSVIKYYCKMPYRRDIQHLRDILSKGKLKATKGTLALSEINYSHEINYPECVDKLVKDLRADKTNYKRIKVFDDSGKFIVIDDNHRLKALKTVLPDNELIDVLFLQYEKPH